MQRVQRGCWSLSLFPGREAKKWKAYPAGFAYGFGCVRASIVARVSTLEKLKEFAIGEIPLTTLRGWAHAQKKAPDGSPIGMLRTGGTAHFEYTTYPKEFEALFESDRVLLFGWGYEISKLRELHAVNPEAFGRLTVGELWADPEPTRRANGLESTRGRSYSRKTGPSWWSPRRRY